MPALEPPLRYAVAADGPRLAELVHYASYGLALAVWKRLAGEGEDPFALGAARCAERADAGEVIAVDGGDGEGVVAAMTGYPVPDTPVDEGLPEQIKVLERLERRAPGTWYLNVLATVPQARGRGHGRRLVALAEEMAREGGHSGVSIIVADGNAGALRLYHRCGYTERARAPLIADGWESASREWVLVAKDIAP